MSEIAPPPWIDPSTLYTRQDIVSLTGIGDEVLSYWIKRGLLKHSEGGDGKGLHRRYHFAQVNIAVILAVFRDRFGANIRTLTSLAKTLQRAVQVFSGTRVRPNDWWKVANLGKQLRAFRAGEEVLIDAHHWSDPDSESVPESEWGRKRAAVSESEIIARELTEVSSHPNAAIKLAERLGPNATNEAAIATALLGFMIDSRSFGDRQWLMLQSGEDWTIREGIDGEFIRGALTEPGVLIPATLLIRKVWKMPAGSFLKSHDKMKRFNAALRDAGISAIVSLGDPYGEGGFIVEPYNEAEAAREIGQKLGYGRAADADPTFARRYEGIYWTPEDNAAEIRRLKDELAELDRQEQADRAEE